MNNKIIIISLFVLTFFSACKNQESEFSDYDYSTVYFAYQAPVRTIELGDDAFYDNTLDKQHQCLIMATTGGVYENSKEIKIGVVVDNSLCDNNLRLVNPVSKDTFNAIAMPSSYYTLPEDLQITIPAGKTSGGIKVQLTDAFFNDLRSADPRSAENIFVIPLRMVSVANADSILSGKSELSNPDRLSSEDWSVAPKDYILYAIKYINPWHGVYLRRGREVGTGIEGYNRHDTTIVYHDKYVEGDKVVNIFTKSMTEDTLSLIATNALKNKPKDEENTMPYTIVLNFDNDGKCIVSNPKNASYTLTGSGKYIKEGDMWGNKKRDVLYLQYTVNFATSTHTFADTLVFRDRQVKFETLRPID